MVFADTNDYRTKHPTPSHYIAFGLHSNRHELQCISATGPQTPTVEASVYNDIVIDAGAVPGVGQVAGVQMMPAQDVSWIEIQIGTHAVLVSYTLIQAVLHVDSRLRFSALSTGVVAYRE